MSTAHTLTPLGHGATLTELKELWSEGAGPRTLLFAGPGSVGRRGAARWLAAYVNCTAGGERPCGQCESCHLFAAGGHPDLKEVGPAAVTGTGRAKRSLEIRIDQLVPRERGEAEPLGPWLLTRPRFAVRVGIIDHAESMNAAAANSLLKLLEEPPPWALIVLVAPGPEALLPTVASRAATVRFRPLPPDQLAGLGSAAHGHPAATLGLPGVLLGMEGEAAGLDDEARNAALGLIDATGQDLMATFEAAEAFAEALASSGASGLGPVGWLRHALREQAPHRYAAAMAAVEECEEALERYAQASLAATVLALRLRQALN